MSSTRLAPSGGVRRLTRLVTLPDGVFRALLGAVVFIFAGLLVTFVVSLVVQARPTLVHFGLSFFTSTTWDPVHVRYGALVFLVGTLETTAIAMLLAVPLGLGAAITLAYVLPRRLRVPLGVAVEMLAAVPSVVYGLWAFVVVVPWAREFIERALGAIGGDRGVVGGPQLGIGLLLAGLILAVMVLPTMTAISRDVLAAVPNEQVEGAFALGATRWQVLRKVVVPDARTGLLGAATLATGRAVGETIAVTMVIGNTDAFAHSLFAPTATMASLIANEFTEATEPFHLSALVGVGIMLLAVSALVNVIARLLVRSVARQRGAIGIA